MEGGAVEESILLHALEEIADDQEIMIPEHSIQPLEQFFNQRLQQMLPEYTARLECDNGFTIKLQHQDGSVIDAFDSASQGELCQIWQAHPFREGNTRSVIAFAVLLAKSLGIEVDHELFQVHSAYVRSALVWASQGIYAKNEYLERIFFDAILHD